MIDTALTFIKNALTESFSNQFENAEDKIAVSNVINPDGSMPNNLEGKIVFFLTSIAQETSLKNNFNRTADKDGKFSSAGPTVHLNLNLLFCANFSGDSYTDGLAYLSAVIRFFQRNTVIIPRMKQNPLSDSKLLFEMVTLDHSELSHLWSAIGSKMMPSVLYKVRLLAFKDNVQGREIPSIVEPSKVKNT
ncbi:MAG: DUF4255 domain-containing protein [Dokdonia sp.]|jgi:hypothetical protein